MRWIGWMLLVQFILVNISAALYAYKLTHVSDDPRLRSHKSSSNVFVKTWRLFSGPRQPRSIITNVPTFPYDTVTLKTGNGLFIDGWYSKPDSNAKGTVILVHGIAANKGLILGEAADFRFQGYNVLMIDFRAHGNSGGNIATIGMRETEELKLAYDYIKGKGEKKIFLWGCSMGAVVVIKTVSQYALQPSGVILEMPFASLQTHLQARARALGFQGFPEKPFGFFVSWWMGVERGFNGLRYKTTNYTKDLKCPVLYQWGTQDNYVLRKETDKVYGAIASANKKLVIYENAGHESLLAFDPKKWRNEVESFLLRNSE